MNVSVRVREIELSNIRGVRNKMNKNERNRRNNSSKTSFVFFFLEKCFQSKYGDHRSHIYNRVRDHIHIQKVHMNCRQTEPFESKIKKKKKRKVSLKIENKNTHNASSFWEPELQITQSSEKNKVKNLVHIE